MTEHKIDLSKIKMLITDVDGVLTDGTVIINGDGSEGKSFSLLDGHGIKLWRRVGFTVGFISGRASKSTTVRAAQLEIDYVEQGAKRKLPVFESMLLSAGLEADEVVYIGSYDDKVYALNASNGNEIWNFTTGGNVRSSPAVSNGVIYIGSTT